MRSKADSPPLCLGLPRVRRPRAKPCWPTLPRVSEKSPRFLGLSLERTVPTLPRHVFVVTMHTIHARQLWDSCGTIVCVSAQQECSRQCITDYDKVVLV